MSLGTYAGYLGARNIPRGPRIYRFEEDRRLGFPIHVTTSSGMASGQCLKLSPGLDIQAFFLRFIKKLRLETNVYEGTDKHYIGIFNMRMRALGKSEVTLISIMIQVLDS
jgi:hypothetical protein